MEVQTFLSYFLFSLSPNFSYVNAYTFFFQTCLDSCRWNLISTAFSNICFQRFVPVPQFTLTEKERKGKQQKQVTEQKLNL